MKCQRGVYLANSFNHFAERVSCVDGLFCGERVDFVGDTMCDETHVHKDARACGEDRIGFVMELWHTAKQCSIRKHFVAVDFFNRPRG